MADVALGFLSFFSGLAGMAGTALQNQIAAQNLELSILSQQISLATALKQAKLQVTSAQTGIDTYQMALDLFPDYSDYVKDVANTEGEAQYNQLLSNFENTEVIAAATGRAGAGTSASRVTGKARGNLTEFVGEDLLFNTEGGGLFAQGFQQLVNNLSAEQQQYEGQLAIFEETLELLTGEGGMIEIIEAGLAELETLTEEEETEETQPTSGPGSPGWDPPGPAYP